MARKEKKAGLPVARVIAEYLPRALLSSLPSLLP